MYNMDKIQKKKISIFIVVVNATSTIEKIEYFFLFNFVHIIHPFYSKFYADYEYFIG